MRESKEEIAQQLEHQQELLRKRRANLQKLELQEANYAGNPPIDLINQLDRVGEQVRETEEEIARLKSLAAEDQLSLVEAEYRTLLAEVWNTPLGRPTVAGATRLELARLNMGLEPERAQELELEIREKLAVEAFESLDIQALFGLSNETNILDRYGELNFTIHAEGEGTINIQELNVSQKIQRDSPLESALKRLGCAIRLDWKIALRLLLQYVPPESQFDLSLFAFQLLSVNRVAIHPNDNIVFEKYLESFSIGLEQLPPPSSTDQEAAKGSSQ